VGTEEAEAEALAPFVNIEPNPMEDRDRGGTSVTDVLAYGSTGPTGAT